MLLFTLIVVPNASNTTRYGHTAEIFCPPRALLSVGADCLGSQHAVHSNISAMLA